MILFYWSAEQFRVSPICVNFCRSYAPPHTHTHLELRIQEIHSFRIFLLHALKFCIWHSFKVLQIKFECCHFVSTFEGVKPLFELRIKEIRSFLHFPPTCSDTLSWNFAYDLRPDSPNLSCLYSTFPLEYPLVLSRFCFLLIYYRSSSSVVGETICRMFRRVLNIISVLDR